MPNIEVAFLVGQDVVVDADRDDPRTPIPREHIGQRGIVREIVVSDRGAGQVVSYRVVFDGDLGRPNGVMVLEKYLRAAR